MRSPTWNRCREYEQQFVEEGSVAESPWIIRTEVCGGGLLSRGIAVCGAGLRRGIPFVGRLGPPGSWPHSNKGLFEGGGRERVGREKGRGNCVGEGTLRPGGREFGRPSLARLCGLVDDTTADTGPRKDSCAARCRVGRRSSCWTRGDSCVRRRRC